uniref:EF-hand domain-containing protein n=1 Tax=Bicosoecida sp. CB-2014 TaxID=1486930 RepID=A0A7S1C7K5_9STRA
MASAGADDTVAVGGAGGGGGKGDGDDAASPFDDLFRRELAGVRARLDEMDARHMMEAGMKAAMGDDTDIRQLQADQVARSAARNRKQLEALWTRFDRDSNGILSRDENRALIKEYLRASKVWTPKVVEETMMVGMQIGLRMATEMMGGDLPDELLSEINLQLNALKPQIQAVAEQVLDGIDADRVADEALIKMDANGDGRVDRPEFMSRFLSVMTEVFNPQDIIVSIQDAMGMGKG